MILPANPLRTTEKIRLEYLDGLRGVTALLVVLGHVYIALRFFGGPVPAPPLLVAMSVFNIGQSGVDVFIVLSGYCLMLPVTRAEGKLEGGPWRFYFRRARRILPPYYAAMALSLLLTAGSNAAGLYCHARTSDLSVGAILSHLFLAHNLRPEWIHAIDPPLWSVATEWQIYLLFPALLLPLWRRTGNIITIAVALTIGLSPHFLMNGLLDGAFPWFLGLFAMGMAAADVNFSASPRLRLLRERPPWGAFAFLLYMGLIGWRCFHPGWYRINQWLADPVIGLATLCLLIACTRARTEGNRSPLARAALFVFDSPATVVLGRFSYSLYLIHYPLMSFVYQSLLRTPLKASPNLFAFALLASVPATVGLAYLFYLVCERPFLPSGQAAQTANAAPKTTGTKFTRTRSPVPSGSPTAPTPQSPIGT